MLNQSALSELVDAGYAVPERYTIQSLFDAEEAQLAQQIAERQAIVEAMAESAKEPEAANQGAALQEQKEESKKIKEKIEQLETDLAAKKVEKKEKLAESEKANPGALPDIFAPKGGQFLPGIGGKQDLGKFEELNLADDHKDLQQKLRDERMKLMEKEKKERLEQMKEQKRAGADADSKERMRRGLEQLGLDANDKSSAPSEIEKRKAIYANLLKDFKEDQ